MIGVWVSMAIFWIATAVNIYSAYRNYRAEKAHWKAIKEVAEIGIRICLRAAADDPDAERMVEEAFE